MPFDRSARTRLAARRRTSRARVAALAAALAVAWFAPHAAAHVQAGAAAPARESQPLGAPAAAAPASNGATGEVVRLVVALGVVVGLAYGVRWWVARTGLAGATAGGGAFEVVARHQVGRGQQVLVARFGPRLLCIQQTREGMRTLAELSDPSEVAAAVDAARGARAPSGEQVIDLRRGKGRAS
jgi:flagellar biogenesis protein FliO